MNKSKSGFTIIELLVVIIVIGILATISVISYSSAQSRARDARRKTDITTISKAMELYYSDHGQYPTPTANTGSSIDNSWYVSSDSSWDMLNNLLVGSEAIDSTPKDPINTPASPLLSGEYGYGIYVNRNSYCGAGIGQMYIIVWRYESMKKEATSEGNCNTNELGSSYFTNGNSYYRNSKI